MQFVVVHELPGIPGRLRLRALSSFSRRQADRLGQRLEALGGLGDVRINPRTGSVLFWYADAAARQSACLLLCGVDVPVRVEAASPATREPLPGQRLGLSLLNYFSYVRCCRWLSVWG